MIPRIIHRIWVGGEPPAHLVSLGQAWGRLHPGWELKVWRDDDLRWLKNQELFDNAEDYVSADAIGQFKADIARYEILYRYGGVYVDFDVEPQKSLEPLIGVEAFVGWEEDNIFLGNTVIGAVPGSKFLRRVIDALPGNANGNRKRSASWLSGPRLITKVYEADKSGITVYPQAYFFPYSYRDMFGPVDPAFKSYPDAYVIHHWEHQRTLKGKPLSVRTAAYDPKISVAIMAHEKRSHWVPDLEYQLEGRATVVWDQKNDRWDTGRRSMLAYDRDATHHVVVQDDAILCRDFLPGLERAISHIAQDVPVGLYFGATTPHPMQTRNMFEQARRLDARWIAHPGPWWGVAVVVPTLWIDEMIAWGDDHPNVQNYDRRMSRFFDEKKVPCFYTMPSLVQHRTENNPSLVPGRTGRHRVAYEFIGNRSPLDLDWSGPVVSLSGRVR